MGQFISLIAKTYGFPEPSVRFVARTLREAGWLTTTGKRGVNAPDMTSMDAARLTLALMAGQTASKALADFEILRSLQTEDVYPTDGVAGELMLPPDHTLEEAVEAIFEVFQHPSIINKYADTSFKSLGPSGPYITISVDASSFGARIDLPSFSAAYADLAARSALDNLYQVRPMTLEVFEQINALELRGNGWDASKVEGRGMRIISTIEDQEIRKISEAMAGLAKTT